MSDLNIIANLSKKFEDRAQFSFGHNGSGTKPFNPLKWTRIVKPAVINSDSQLSPPDVISGIDWVIFGSRKF